jgi:hypothetical protein
MGTAGICHPRQSGVAQAVAAEVFVAELGDDLVPVSGVPQDRGADSSATGSGEQASIGVSVGGGDSTLDEFVHFRDEWNDACAFAFGGLVGESAR